MAGRFARRSFFETLESRQLLAIDLNAGVLTVIGTGKSDRISLVLKGDQVHVALNKQSESFALASISQITLTSHGGNDRITVDAGIALAATISGGSGNDKIVAGGGNDIISGGKGNDRCDGGAGDDALFGESGNDRLVGGIGNDTLDAASGNDWLIGWDGNDVLSGGAGVDHLYGNEGDDQASGGAKNDKLIGGPGLDILSGGDGHDILAGNEDDDLLFGDGGHDKIYGHAGDDTLHGGWGNDRLSGGDGDDLLDGDEGHDHELGGTSVDLDIELSAVLAGSLGVTGHADYSHEADDLDGAALELVIEIDGAVPLTPLEVKIDGTSIGSIEVDAAGHGRLKFSSDPDSEGDTELEFPAEFSLHSGSTILIGLDITGTFAAPV
jgi:Ca2+-binding RTX toxin-like protein